MADIADKANDITELARQRSLEAVPKYHGTSATHCEDCDEEIPEGRRRAVPGVKLCAFCQDYQERKL